MEAIDRMLARCMPAVPVVAFVLISLCSYLLVKRRRSDLVDSPWFWVALFSTVGLLGLWAVSPKYDDRQKRLEARYEARERIADARSRSDSKEPIENRDGANQDAPLQSGYQPAHRVPLQYLAAALLLISAVSIGILFRRPKNDRGSDK